MTPRVSPEPEQQAALYERVLASAAAAHEEMRRQGPDLVIAAAAAMTNALRDGGKVLIFGNGGSAADAQHMAAELVGRLERKRPAIAAVALSTDTSILTAVANDDGFDRVFARQVDALGRAGDVVLAISTSGDSNNVLAGVAAARERGVTVIALTGRDGGELGRRADVHLNVPVANTARAQEVHRTVLHILCEIVETELARGSGSEAVKALSPEP
jgi:D-sedoheptulose 7-phosphate isomerase